jgi:ribonuclease HI
MHVGLAAKFHLSAADDKSRPVKMRFLRRHRPVRVYVDAKILNMHDPALPREAYVGYVVEGKGRHDVKRVEATESDDAEVLAIMFAIEELRDSLGHFTIICDHESVVSEATRESVTKPSELLKRLREMLRENPSVRLEALQSNLAHQAVTEHVNALKAGVR